MSCLGIIGWIFKVLGNLLILNGFVGYIFLVFDLDLLVFLW